MDEASRIQKQLMSEVVAPLAKVKHTFFLMLSTALDLDNWFSKLFLRSDPYANEMLVRINVQLHCSECKRKKIPASKCKHFDHCHPPWNVAGNQDRSMLLMDNDEDLFNQEVLGAIVGGFECVFAEEWRKKLSEGPGFSMESINSEEANNLIIYHFVDPDGGGSGSEFAIVSAMRQPDGSVIILGLGSMSTQNDLEILSLCDRYFARFRESIFSFAQHVLILENNFGGPQSCDLILHRIVHCLPKRTHIFNSMPQRTGVRTDDNNKRMGTLATISYMNQDKIQFSSSLLTHLPVVVKGKDEAANAATMRKKFMTQCGNFRRVRNATGRGIKFTGKKPGVPDDMISALVLLIYWSNHIIIKLENDSHVPGQDLRFDEQHRAQNFMDHFVRASIANELHAGGQIPSMDHMSAGLGMGMNNHSSQDSFFAVSSFGKTW